MYFDISDTTILLESHARSFGYLIRTHPRGTFELNRDGLTTLKLLHAGLSLAQAADLIATCEGLPVAICRQRVGALVAALQSRALVAPATGVARSLHLKRVTTSRPLLRLFLSLTEGCNLACAHCYADATPPGEGARLSFDEVARLIAEAHELGVYEFDVTGGEPFIRADLWEILDLLDRFGMLVNLYTNGTLLDANAAARLARYPRLTMIVSLDSIEPAVHDALRGKAGAQRRTLDALRALKAQGVPLRINVSLTRSTRPSVKRTVDFAYDELGALSVVVAPIFPVGRGTELSKENVSSSEASAVLREVYGAAFAKALGALGTSASSQGPPCGVAAHMMFLSARGDVSLCPTLTAREDPTFHLGNLHDRSLRDIWEQALASNPHMGVQCSAIDRCRFAGQCRGGCRSRAFLLEGSLRAVDSYTCAAYQVLADE